MMELDNPIVLGIRNEHVTLRVGGETPGRREVRAHHDLIRPVRVQRHDPSIAPICYPEASRRIHRDARREGESHTDAGLTGAI